MKLTSSNIVEKELWENQGKSEDEIQSGKDPGFHKTGKVAMNGVGHEFRKHLDLSGSLNCLTREQLSR